MNNRSTTATILRALLALVALAVLLAGVPYALLTVGVLPDHLPSLDEVGTALTSPDSGALFLGAITLIGWYGYGTFVISVVLETAAALRHRSAPRIRLLGGSQQLAGALVGGILILLPTGTAFASPASAAPVAAVASAVPQASTAPQTSTTATTATSSAYDGPVHRVVAGDTLWDIAEQQLGGGIEWHRIIDVNKDVPQADGTLITADTTDLQPGWVLRLPSDAAPADQAATGLKAQTAGSTSVQADTHTVRAGETLSSIAKDVLGDADEYPEIAEMNLGDEQADGRTFTDPDDIHPGWELKVPAAGAHGAESPSAESAAPETAVPAPENATPPAQVPTRGPDQAAPVPATSAPQQPSAAQTPAAPTAQAPTPAEQAPTVAPAEQAPASDGQDQDMLRTVAAAGSITAAGVLAVIAGRRALQQRRRRPRRRIPIPVGQAAQFESDLRAASDLSGIQLVDRALRTLAANCAKTGQPLPQLEAIRITSRGLEVHLAAPTPQIAPFSEMDENPDLWWCPTRPTRLLDEDKARDITPPYPALVSFGETDEGEPVLVNLESIGALRLSGTDADVRAVMLGMAVELASSGLSDDTTVVLAGLGAELAGVFPVRVEHQEDLGRALPELRAHDALQRGALDAGEFDGLDDARLADGGGDTWVPKVLISPLQPSVEEADDLTDLFASRPRTASALVVGAGSQLAVSGAWTLPAAPGSAVQLPGLDLAVTLQRLEAAAYLPLIELLATADRTDDVAAPAWTHAPDGAPAPNGPSPLAPRGDSALAQDQEEGDTSEEGSLNDAGDEQPAAALTAPLMQVSVSPVSSSLATAVPSFSALAPSVTGTVTGRAEDPAEEEPEAETAPSVRPVSKDLFDEALQDVLDEQEDVPPTEQTVEADDQDEPADLDGTAAGQSDEEDSGLSPAALGRPVSAQSASETAAPVRPVARVTAVTSSVLAALNTTPEPPSAPQIRVLGPVDVISTLGKVESNRRNGLTEIAAWLALHPGKSRHELDEAIWPGQRIRADDRNTNVSKLRAWLGRDPLLAASDPHSAYLPPIVGGVYSLHDDVSTDWQRFQEYYQEGMHRTGTDADTALASALALVRGRPFSDINQSKYCWAEYDIQEMISATVDVAHELATRRLAARDYRAALAAASRGLICDQMSELLYRDLFTIYSETGDRQGLDRTAHQLSRIAIESGYDSAPETVSLINALMDANRIASA